MGWNVAKASFYILFPPREQLLGLRKGISLGRLSEAPEVKDMRPDFLVSLVLQGRGEFRAVLSPYQMWLKITAKVRFVEVIWGSVR